MSKVSTCLWFGKDAEAAARFYVSLVPNSSLEHIQRAPNAWPGGEAGDVILVTFNLAGQSFQALNGGTPANYGTAASISVLCADQVEVDRLWAALTADGGSLALRNPSVAAHRLLTLTKAEALLEDDAEQHRSD